MPSEKNGANVQSRDRNHNIIVDNIISDDSLKLRSILVSGHFYCVVKGLMRHHSIIDFTFTDSVRVNTSLIS